MLKRIIFLQLLPLMVMLGCSDQGKEQLGDLSFEVDGKEEAQSSFKRGLLLLHSFEFEDAADAFLAARTIDPDFVMAYWGEAMTCNHPLWRFQDKDKAMLILNALSTDPEKRIDLAQTEIEKDFMRAIHTLYGQGSKEDNDQAYAEHMKKMYEKYPGHDEVASFYSIALLGSISSGRDEAIHQKAADIAKEVIERSPRHPGALHYYIHAYDDPENARQAVAAADRYSEVAPSAAHALHMPSHIYLAIGDWSKVISSNEDSWKASYDRKISKGLSNDALDYHSLHWLLYGYIQVGKYDKAQSLLEDMMDYCEELPSVRARYHLVLMRSTFAIGTNQFNHPSLDIKMEMNDLNVLYRTIDRSVKSMKAYNRRDSASLYELSRAIKKDIYFNEIFLSSEDVKLCSGSDPTVPNSFDIQQAKVMEIQSQALMARLSGEEEKAYSLLQEAVNIEMEISQAYGPPPIVKPSAELMGEWQIKDGHPDKAIDYFKQSLVQAPNRTMSKEGKAFALSLLDTKEL